MSKLGQKIQFFSKLFKNVKQQANRI
jgi:hypothetical protein